jgi:gamma-glutamyltranspeptidase/glutathione hydrolase/leukotriene-C4 hydrolase
MIIRPSTSHSNPNPNCTQPLSIDFRETAPSGAHARMFSPRPDDPTFDSARASRVGGLAIGVPGELRGLEAAYLACGGGLPWARLVQPAADLARKSKVGLELGRRLGIDAFSGWMVDAVNEGWAPFVKKGRTLRAGETLRRENYARTLETIGREGVDVFYEGHIAKSIIHTIEKAGGILTAKDLAGYRPIILPATKATYRNRTYYTGHAPSGGPVIVSLLNTLEGFPNYAEGGRTGLAVHRFIESLKCESTRFTICGCTDTSGTVAFAARTELGDPAFIHNNKRLAEITTKAYAAQVRANISDVCTLSIPTMSGTDVRVQDRTYTIDHYNPRFDVKEDHGTTHLSVIDSHGSAISITSTVNLLFGSRVMDVETGIILNDEMVSLSSSPR